MVGCWMCGFVKPCGYMTTSGFTTTSKLLYDLQWACCTCSIDLVQFLYIVVHSLQRPTAPWFYTRGRCGTCAEQSMMLLAHFFFPPASSCMVAPLWGGHEYLPEFGLTWVWADLSLGWLEFGLTWVWADLSLGWLEFGLTWVWADLSLGRKVPTAPSQCCKSNLLWKSWYTSPFVQTSHPWKHVRSTLCFWFVFVAHIYNIATTLLFPGGLLHFVCTHGAFQLLGGLLGQAHSQILTTQCRMTICKPKEQKPPRKTQRWMNV